MEFLSEVEQKQRNDIIQQLNDAYNQRQQTYIELDDQNYDQWYLSNKKAATGYTRPKKNKQDLRVVTGTTREKCNTVVTSLLRYNFDFTIDAYDENDWADRDVGFGLEGLVRKSRKLEEPSYEEKRKMFYNEFVAQGNVFLYEMTIEEEELHKRMKNESVDDLMKMKWTEDKKITKRCEVDMVPGLNVYLGNIREFYMDKQPFIGLRREIHKWEAKALYGEWARYEMAMGKKGEEAGTERVLADQGGQEYNDFSILMPQSDYVEEVRYFSMRTNTYQILLNGCPMLPEGFPLEYALGVNKYPVVKVDGEPIGRYFAYCRGLASKNKFNQAMIDDLYRTIALKFRKSTNPPMANLTGKILNKSIFYPGTIHKGVDPEKLKPIGDNQAVTGPEFNVFQLVKGAIDESSVSPIFEGNRTPGEKTAKEVADLKTQSLMRLGMVMVGAIQMEERLVWLRTYNILKNWTAPIDVKLEETRNGIKRKPIYRTESVERELEEGVSGVHMIEFGEELPDKEQVYAEEKHLTRKKGMEVRKTYLNAKDLATLKYRFFVKVIPVEVDHNELESALFEESLGKAFSIFPTEVNRTYWMGKWAGYKRLDPKKAFISGAPPMPMAEGMGAPDKTVGAQAKPQISQQVKPSLKRMQQT